MPSFPVVRCTMSLRMPRFAVLTALCTTTATTKHGATPVGALNNEAGAADVQRHPVLSAAALMEAKATDPSR